MYLLLYVNGMLLAAKKMSEINKIKEVMSSEFKMKDMGPASRILGIDIKREINKGILCFSHSNYLENVIHIFQMWESKTVNTPIGAHFKLASVRDLEECVDTDKVLYSSIVGSVMYAMVGTRPDLAYAIGLVSRSMRKPGDIHWEAVKWLLRYIKGSLKLNMVYTKEKEVNKWICFYCRW